MKRLTRYGTPLPLPPPRPSGYVVLEPLGMDVGQPASDLTPGYSPFAENFIIRDGALEPRPVLVSRSSQTVGFNSPILGGFNAVSVAGNEYPFVSGQSWPLYYSAGSWSRVSYVSAFGVDAPPTNSATTYWDMASYYYDKGDENCVVMASGSYQTLYVWQSATTVFSTLTGAPMAKYVAPLNAYLLAFNIRDPGSGANDFVQRLQWNDRGSLSSWTGGLAGFVDLLDMRGMGTRIVGQEQRALLFSGYEIWQAIPTIEPALFDVQPIDRSVGCPYSWTVTDTPAGCCFLGNDNEVYLVPKGGGPATRITTGVQAILRDQMQNPERAWGVWNPLTATYELYYVERGGSTYPQKSLTVNVATGAWMKQSYTHELPRGFMGTIAEGSAGTTWDGLVTAGLTWDQLNLTWSQLMPQGGTGPLALYLGSSSGTMYTASSAATTDDGVATVCRWRSGGMGGELPGRTKTLTEVRVDYQSGSLSTMTLRCSPDGGANFPVSTTALLPLSSEQSQSVMYVYMNARYPVIEMEVDGSGPKIYRMTAALTPQGR